MLNPMTGYAATALAWLAMHNDAPTRVKEIAQSTGVPAPFLGKIINVLARRHIVSTQRGVGGGVKLIIDPKKVTLYCLSEVLDDPILTPKCMLSLDVCSDERACPAHEFAKAQRRRQILFLKRTTIADILKFELEHNPSWTLDDERGSR